jgi:hypothetical protein
MKGGCSLYCHTDEKANAAFSSRSLLFALPLA